MDIRRTRELWCCLALVALAGAGLAQEAETKPVDWAKVPPLGPRSRSGLFVFRPSGPGYYQLLDLLKREQRLDSPPEPFGLTSVNGVPSFEYDFRFLDKSENTYHPWSSVYKRVHVGEDFLFSTGGELRYRFNNYSEYQLSERNETHDLTRLRLYGDLWYRDDIRLFVEMLDARIFHNTLPPATNDRTGTDLLNVFAEVKMADIAGAPVQIRAGRQEITLGSQRLIASPDFANTLRTFDGVRSYWHSPMWDVDAFWVRPVVPNANRLDSSDNQRAFSGVYAIHRPTPHAQLEVYLLNLNDTRTATLGDIVTFGGRFAGDVEKRLLFDFEAAAQTGTTAGKTISANMATAGLGWHFARLPWNVSFWTLYDYASGNSDPTNKDVTRTFNQLFGGNHAYFGYIDLVGRQNIRDLCFQFEMNPQPWIQFRTQYHLFNLVSSRDALYNLAGTPLRRDPTGRAGDEVGSELDFLLNFHLTPHQDVVLGYSRLFAGRFLRATGTTNDPQYFYAQYSFRF
jgi:Alginate export